MEATKREIELAAALGLEPEDVVYLAATQSGGWSRSGWYRIGHFNNLEAWLGWSVEDAIERNGCLLGICDEEAV